MVELPTLAALVLTLAVPQSTTEDPVPAASVAAPSAGTAEIVRILRGLRDRDHQPLEELLPAFTAAGRGVPHDLHDMLVTGRVLDLGDGVQVLSVIQRRLILDAYGELGGAFLRRELGTRLSAPADPAERRAAVRTLGVIADAYDLETLLDFAHVEGEERLDRDMDGALREATAAILRRDSRAFDRLQSMWRSTPIEVRGALLAGVGATRDPRSLELVKEVIAWHADDVGQAIAQVPKIGASSDQRLNDELAFHLRSFIGPDRPSHMRAAILAVAALDDLESIPLLIELLDHESRGVRQNSLWALRDLTGQNYSSDAKRWSYWHAREVEWSRREQGKLFRQVVSRDAAEVMQALREISKHPLARHELGIASRTLARHRSHLARAEFCRTAAKLACREAIAHLVDLLADPSQLVSRAAWEALVEITGEDLPAEPGAWWGVLSS